ncbi:MAG: Spy/CpxP family protein refolding chaperone [Pseudomonadales bacterium]|nr:Spy/CpxP family protein refolding chaperone [Pseudomonadales bacterium]
MKKSKKLIIGSLIAITLGTVGALAAGGFEHRWGHNGDRANMMAERMMKHATEALDLTQEQQAYLEILQQKMIALKTDGMKGKFETRKEVMEQLSQPTLDQAYILNMVQERLRSAEQKAPELIAALAQFSDSLTSEQKNAIKEKIEEHHKHRKDHH